MVFTWRNFKNIFSRPLFTIIFRPKILLFFVTYSILTGQTKVEFVIYWVLRGGLCLFQSLEYLAVSKYLGSKSTTYYRNRTDDLDSQSSADKTAKQQLKLLATASHARRSGNKKIPKVFFSLPMISLCILTVCNTYYILHMRGKKLELASKMHIFTLKANHVAWLQQNKICRVVD